MIVLLKLQLDAKYLTQKICKYLQHADQKFVMAINSDPWIWRAIFRMSASCQMSRHDIAQVEVNLKHHMGLHDIFLNVELIEGLAKVDIKQSLDPSSTAGRGLNVVQHQTSPILSHWAGVIPTKEIPMCFCTCKRTVAQETYILEIVSSRLLTNLEIFLDVSWSKLLCRPLLQMLHSKPLHRVAFPVL